MIRCFGASWRISNRKLWIAGTVKGIHKPQFRGQLLQFKCKFIYLCLSANGQRGADKNLCINH